MEHCSFKPQQIYDCEPTCGSSCCFYSSRIDELCGRSLHQDEFKKLSWCIHEIWWSVTYTHVFVPLIKKNAGIDQRWDEQECLMSSHTRSLIAFMLVNKQWHVRTDDLLSFLSAACCKRELQFHMYLRLKHMKILFQVNSRWKQSNVTGVIKFERQYRILSIHMKSRLRSFKPLRLNANNHCKPKTTVVLPYTRV